MPCSFLRWPPAYSVEPTEKEHALQHGKMSAKTQGLEGGRATFERENGQLILSASYFCTHLDRRPIYLTNCKRESTNGKWCLQLQNDWNTRLKKMDGGWGVFPNSLALHFLSQHSTGKCNMPAIKITKAPGV